jgi:bidirectional [NiFe] hydrogenase diaphorase subunit
LIAKLEHRCAKAGQTTSDGKVSVETARCIGSCGLAPAVICDGNVLARVTPEALDAELTKIGLK